MRSLNRRDLAKGIGLGSLSLAATGWSGAVRAALAQQEEGGAAKAGAREGQAPAAADHDMSAYAIPAGPPQQIAMLLYPKLTLLDLIGPQQFLAALGNVQVHLVWKDRSLVTTDTGIAIQPSRSFSECPEKLTLLFVPGGSEGTVACMRDPEVLRFLAERGAKADWVASVCTGSLVLGAAGLLDGYRATSHWTARSLLPLVGATPVAERVVVDRNRITGAGVTAGLDFALHLAAKLRNERYAKALQLAFEYDPKPPFQAGTPEGAGPEVAGMLNLMYAPTIAAMADAARSSAERAPRKGQA